MKINVSNNVLRIASYLLDNSIKIVENIKNKFNNASCVQFVII